MHETYYTPYDTWPIYTGGGITGLGGASFSSADGLSMTMDAPSTGDGMSYDVTGLHSGMSAKLVLTSSSIIGTFTATLTDDSTHQVIGSTQLYNTQGNPTDYTVYFTALSGGATLRVVGAVGGGTIVIGGLGTPHDTLEPMGVVTTVCDNDFYRYGDNGQLKVNEIAGLGNHYTALFWDYDPRRAGRWNLDPVQVPSQSPYAVFDNSPVAKKDPNGDCVDCPTEAKNLESLTKGGKLADGFIWSDQTGKSFIYDKHAGSARPLESGDLAPALSNMNTPPSHSASSPESEQFNHGINEWVINMTPILGEANMISHVISGKGLQDIDSKKSDDVVDRVTMSLGAQASLKGMNNLNTKRAASVGNSLHYDQLNGGTGEGLPTQLAQQYPETRFYFTPRGAKGQDVEVRGGIHPSQYPGSTWKPGNNYGDFKPSTPSGIYNFGSKIKTSKLPQNTEMLLYDPQTGKLK